MKLKIIVLFVIGLAVFLANYHSAKKDIETPLINKVFPKQFDDWVGEDLKVSKSVYKMLEPNELLLRKYVNKKTKQDLTLSIVLTNKRAQIHDPEVCYRYQGIVMDKEETVSINKNCLAKHVFGVKNKSSYDIIYWYTDLNKTFPDRAKFMKHIALSKFIDKPIIGFALVTIISPQSNDNKEVLKFSSMVNDLLNELDKN